MGLPLLHHPPRPLLGIVNVNHSGIVSRPQVNSGTRQAVDFVRTCVENAQTRKIFCRVNRNLPVVVPEVDPVELVADHCAGRDFARRRLRQWLQRHVESLLAGRGVVYPDLFPSGQPKEVSCHDGIRVSAGNSIHQRDQPQVRGSVLVRRPDVELALLVQGPYVVLVAVHLHDLPSAVGVGLCLHDVLGPQIDLVDLAHVVTEPYVEALLFRAFARLEHQRRHLHFAFGMCEIHRLSCVLGVPRSGHVSSGAHAVPSEVEYLCVVLGPYAVHATHGLGRSSVGLGCVRVVGGGLVCGRSAAFGIGRRIDSGM